MFTPGAIVPTVVRIHIHLLSSARREIVSLHSWHTGNHLVIDLISPHIFLILIESKHLRLTAHSCTLPLMFSVQDWACDVHLVISMS